MPRIHIQEHRNNSGEFDILYEVIRIGPRTEIFDATFEGPFSSLQDSQIGADVQIGRYTSFNRNSYISRTTIGSFCSIGARVSINPFNHPADWLSVHEFQYQTASFGWIEEYRTMDRLERTPDMLPRSNIGHDVWSGHNVVVMPGVTIGNGAILAACAVVTKDVPPYAIVAGVPAKIIKYRYDESTIDRLMKVEWWALDLKILSGLPYRDPIASLERLEAVRAEMRDN